MPSEAFQKLDENKKNKIINAMKKEFGRTAFDKTSVERIVKDAGISKGSFWVYFENKSEAIDYIIDMYMKDEYKIFKNKLINNNGDLFSTAREMYEYLVENNDARLLMGNIIQVLMTNQEREIAEYKEKGAKELKSFFKIIDTSNINKKYKEKEYIITLIKMITQSIRANALVVILNKCPEKDASENLERELTILKNGICS